jgi:D-xylono/L-arabinono-1,4-lactonase
MFETLILEIMPATDFACELAENPLWDPERNCVYWTDITAGKMYRLDLYSGLPRLIYQGPTVGGFTLQRDGELLLFRVHDIAVLHRNETLSVQQTVADGGMERFNDVIADPEGRVFAGTIGKTDQCGGLYRLEPCGTLTKLFAGTGCSNGMGFSLDTSRFYWTCSTTRQIFQFDYDRSTGELRDRRLFYAASPGEGIPDGLAVDAEGYIWSARWGGGSIIRHAPDGSVITSIPFPVPNVSSLCFAGDNLDRIVVTSAKQAEVRSSGFLFETKAPVRGLKEFRSGLGLK